MNSRLLYSYFGYCNVFKCIVPTQSLMGMVAYLSNGTVVAVAHASLAAAVGGPSGTGAGVRCPGRVGAAGTRAVAATTAVAFSRARFTGARGHVEGWCVEWGNCSLCAHKKK